jgi:hypothetical protein
LSCPALGHGKKPHPSTASIVVLSAFRAGDVWLDLGATASKYLTGWSVSPSEFDDNGAPVRRLVDTAGLTADLGYMDLSRPVRRGPSTIH